MTVSRGLSDAKTLFPETSRSLIHIPDPSIHIPDAFIGPAAGSVAVAGTSLVPAPMLFLLETGDTTAISVNDIHQGQLGDCFVLSPLGEIAMDQPGFISNAIHVNGNGTEAVTLYTAANGTLPSWSTTAFKPVTETVTNVFAGGSVNNGATQAVSNGIKEIWPQVIEKAVATLDGGYAKIANGGSPLLAMEELTGHATSCMSPGSLTLAALQGFTATGALVVMDTTSGSSLPGALVGNHAYMFEGVTGTGSGATVRLGNPWGFDQPAPLTLSQLTHALLEVDVGHLT